MNIFPHQGHSIQCLNANFGPKNGLQSPSSTKKGTRLPRDRHFVSQTMRKINEDWLIPILVLGQCDGIATNISFWADFL